MLPAAPVVPVILIPTRPEAAPLIIRFRRFTVLWVSPPPKESNAMLIALVPALLIEPRISWQSSVIDFVIVMAPKPPGSRQLISPSCAVLEIAPAKVLQGAVRLHGLTSSPTPDTQVRVA